MNTPAQTPARLRPHPRLRRSAAIYGEVVRGAGFTHGWATGCRLRITPAADSRSCTGPFSDIISPGFAVASGGRLRGFSSPHQDSDGTAMTHRSVALLFGDPFALALRHTEVGRALGQGAGPLPWPELGGPNSPGLPAFAPSDRPMTQPAPRLLRRSGPTVFV